MTGMPTIDSIRRKRRDGATITAIARDLEISEPTVRKYLRADGLSPRPPVRASRPSILDPYMPLIRAVAVRRPG
ncbi:transposase [Bifidobacterium cuniculi]|uniref:Transposase n=1 Tax=Bifidobacterium cuniculi TaxID=1688 RepID=A0A087AZL3_9BIFI|nr:transposase [Bifidobacterium cuniculi]